MPDDSLRRRLEALNRGPLPDPPAAPKVATTSRSRPPQRNLPPQAVKRIPGLLRRAQVVSNARGEHLQIDIPVAELWHRGPQLVEARLAQLHNDLDRLEPELAAVVQAFHDRVLLLDLETCGLAGSALFLIGNLRLIQGQLVVQLLLARNYAEECAVLQTFWQVVAGCEMLVTFNGKAFDWPMVLDRSQRYLLFRDAEPPGIRHVDLLHHARRRWRSELPDCKLQTLEQRICNRGRVGDIPGSMIPAAYADYVRTGFEREIEAVLFHNALDLVTLLDLAMRIPA